MPVTYNTEEKSEKDQQLIGVAVLVLICVGLLYLVFKVSRKRK
tara:strand:- start:3202 stop:3330 length:129 start_codon:yes stop_codon:yes gene_type:complete